MKKYLLSLFCALFSILSWAQYSENFDASTALPTGWVAVSGTPDVRTLVGEGATNALRLNASGEGVRTQAITNPGSLTFSYKPSVRNSNFSLIVRATDGTTTVTLQTYAITAASATFTTVTIPNLFDNVTINPANFKLEFVLSTYTNSNEMLIDNVSITAGPFISGVALLEEGFENGIPVGDWINNNCTTGNVPRSGRKALLFDATGDAITTPVLASPGRISFFRLSESYDPSTTWNAAVEVLNYSGTVVATLASIATAPYEYANENNYSLTSYYNVRIRIRDTRASGSSKRYVDDIKVIGKNQPDISIYSFNHTIYHDNQDYLAEDGTDMFRRQTYATDGYGYWAYSYTIRNIGSQTLTIGTMSITGADTKNFRFITHRSGTSIASGGSASFVVEYNPRYAGEHYVTVNIPTNDPDIPIFKINLKGFAVDCELPQNIIAENDFENNATATLPYTEVDVFGNTGPANFEFNPLTNSGTTYWPRNQPMQSSGTKSWSTRNKQTVLQFGPVNVSGLKGLGISLEAAGFSSVLPYYDGGTRTVNAGATGGLDPDDRLEIYISTDNGTTWSKEVYIEGANRTLGQSNSTFTFSTVTSRTFMMNLDDNNSFLRWGNDRDSQDEVGYFILDIPDDLNLNSLMFRIYAKTDASDELLLVDNVKVFSRGVPKTKTWHGPAIGWKDELGAPSSKSLYTQKVIFAENYDSSVHSGDIEACKCDIAAGKTVTIRGNNYMKIESDILNDGTLNIESDANLVQVSKKGTYTGTNPTAIVKRNANLKIRDYNYWGTPVIDPVNLQAFSPNTLSTNFYTYNESNDLFVRIASPATTNFELGKGYAIRAPNDFTTTSTVFNGQFIGKPTNGDVLVPLVFTDAAHGYNLISNPYPSNIDSSLLYQSNSSLIYNTFYLWTNTNYNPKMQGSNYPANLPTGTQVINNYAVINGTGGLGAPYGFTGTGTNTPVSFPNKFLKVGQGFVVKAKSAGNLLFENEMRSTDNSAIFFNRMSSNTKGNNKNTETTMDRFWVNLKTPLDFVTPLLIGYSNGATDNYEMDYDAELFILGGDSFYSILDGLKLGIQGKKYPLNSTKDVITLGARFGLQGSYEIALDKVEGVFANGQNIYLKDNFTGVVTNLSQSPYTFTADAGEVNNRFEIIYNYKTLGSDEASQKEPVVIYKEDSGFVINANEVITSVKLFDATGRLVNEQKVEAKSTKILFSNTQKGVFLVEIITPSKRYTKKIIN